MINLRPCPFCGSDEAVIDHMTMGLSMTSYVRCNKCFARIHGVTISTQYSSDDKAAELWNRRYTDDDLK